MQKAIAYYLILLAMIILRGLPAGAQQLDNLSFEGEPQDATMPMGWFQCSEGTTPDILPGPWGVSQRPADGLSFVGLITRPDGSFESIGQRFSQPLEKDQCYQISLDLARSPAYADYNEAIRIRLWLSEDKCSRQELLGETGPVTHYDWKTYSFKLLIQRPYEYIRIEVVHPDGRSRSAGNVLIDHIRPLIKCTGA